MKQILLAISDIFFIQGYTLSDNLMVSPTVDMHIREDLIWQSEKEQRTT